MIKLTEEQKRMAVNLAMIIECGIYPLDDFMDMLENDPDVMQSIISFWADFNDMTRQVAKLVIYERARQHCEHCFRLPSAYIR